MRARNTGRWFEIRPMPELAKVRSVDNFVLCEEYAKVGLLFLMSFTYIHMA